MDFCIPTVANWFGRKIYRIKTIYLYYKILLQNFNPLVDYKKEGEAYVSPSQFYFILTDYRLQAQTPSLQE